MKQVFYVPERGDVMLISLQAGAAAGRTARRAAVVLSPQAYNARIGLALLCPIVTEVKGYPFEVRLPAGLPVQGAVLADQAASLDWRVLRAERIGALPPDTVEEALGKLKALLD
jgi:mRNA interferase MazF